MKDFQCLDCEYKFSIEWRLNRRPYCNNCGDNIRVLRYPYDKRGRYDSRIKNPELKRGRWTDEEIEKLNNLRATTTLTYEEIGERLNRSKDAVGQKIADLHRNRNK